MIFITGIIIFYASILDKLDFSIQLFASLGAFCRNDILVFSSGKGSEDSL